MGQLLTFQEIENADIWCTPAKLNPPNNLTKKKLIHVPKKTASRHHMTHISLVHNFPQTTSTEWDSTTLYFPLRLRLNHPTLWKQSTLAEFLNLPSLTRCSLPLQCCTLQLLGCLHFQLTRPQRLLPLKVTAIKTQSINFNQIWDINIQRLQVWYFPLQSNVGY